MASKHNTLSRSIRRAISREFGSLCKEERGDLTQEEFAVLAKWQCREIVSKVELGDLMSKEVVHAVARVMKISVTVLLKKVRDRLEAKTKRSWAKEFDNLHLRRGPKARGTSHRRQTGYCPVDESVEVRFPFMNDFWDEHANGDLRPAMISVNYKGLIHLKCAKGPDHRFTTTVRAFVNSKARERCPFCAGRRASITNCLATVSPKLTLEYDLDSNCRMPHEIIASPPESISPWWNCLDPECRKPESCKHYRMSLRHRLEGGGCDHNPEP